MSDLSDDQLRSVGALSWLTIGVGILSLIAGVIVILKPSNSLATIAVVVGIFAVVDGIVALVRAIGGPPGGRAFLVLVGIISLVIGVILIRHPSKSVSAIALVIGIWLIAMGAIRLVLAFETSGDRGWLLFVAIVELIAGVVIVAEPHIGVTALALILGIGLVLNGLALTAAGAVLHRARGVSA
jgi:uncharacterized membrane protein HdeD (DUF308 family)